ncbi:FUSC family protein [Taibaiella sp. KBW10]|uniref:FUSC family protein n=1 Tax=Taibaiella sp. KBW10 TaxID=2153357 RepID=UPI0018F4C179|nr:FUSC family protein [Taibaiella sp. KBW10]
MATTFKQVLQKETNAFFTLNKSNRVWHIPLLAALSVGMPLIAGLLLGNLKASLTASLGGLVILYYAPSIPLAGRMITLLACSFGFMLSYTIGHCFSFNPYASAIVFGLWAMAVHWIVSFFKTRAPGNFFFIMMASMASCQPFDLHHIPQKIGLMGLGTMWACMLALVYGLLTLHKQTPSPHNNKLSVTIVKNEYTSLVESGIMGFFMFSALLIGHLLAFKNPYWIPISCLAVMQGVSRLHIWQRVVHRIVGTFVGLCLCWLALSISKTPLSICISIILLQFIVESLIVRHYALAVIFITPMTILLAEAGNPLIQDPNHLLAARVTDIIVGSMIGAIGGWVIYHEKLRQSAIRQIRKTKVLIHRR